MRKCPVCVRSSRKNIFSMDFRVPDEFPLPSRISWFKCKNCGMLYGDGEMSQGMFDDYYRRYYGYGLNGSENIKRLEVDAEVISGMCEKEACIVDIGGDSDVVDSVFVAKLKKLGHRNAHNNPVGCALGKECDLIYASHVLEHVYDLPGLMGKIVAALRKDSGVLVVDVPDSAGLLCHWKAPILDFTTKHLNHFALRNLLDLGWRYGLEGLQVRHYSLNGMSCLQVHFRAIDIGGGLERTWRMR